MSFEKKLLKNRFEIKYSILPITTTNWVCASHSSSLDFDTGQGSNEHFAALFFGSIKGALNPNFLNLTINREKNLL